MSEQPASTLRCAFCHGSAEGATPCPSCAALVHPDCLRQSGACPTLGCALGQRPLAPGELKPSHERARRLAIVTLVNGVAAAWAGGVGWALIARSRDEWDSLAFGPSLLLALVAIACACLARGQPVGRRRRRAGLALAVVCVGVVSVLLARALPAELRRRAPITEAELGALARTLDERPYDLGSLLDLHAAVEALDPSGDHFSSEERRDAWLGSFFEGSFEELDGLLKAHGSWKVLRWKAEPHPSLVARTVTADCNDFRYFELLLSRRVGGKLSVVEQLSLGDGDSLGIRILSTSRRGMKQTHELIYRLAEERKTEELLRVISELPPEQRADSTILRLRLAAAAERGKEEHEAALEAMIAAALPEIGAELIEYDLACVREDHAAAMAALDALDRRVGGDPFLNVKRAELLLEAGQPARAMELALQAARSVPDVTPVWWGVLRCAARTRDHAHTVEAMQRLAAGGTTIELLEREEGLEEFFASPALEDWKRWKSEHPPAVEFPPMRQGG